MGGKFNKNIRYQKKNFNIYNRIVPISKQPLKEIKPRNLIYNHLSQAEKDKIKSETPISSDWIDKLFS